MQIHSFQVDLPAMSDARTESFDFQQTTIHGLFSEQAKTHHDRVAVQCGDQSRRYSEVEKHANQIAQYLVDHGVNQGDLVGVCVERGNDVPAVLLGILKAGAGYVPLDPDYPRDRLRYMCQDAGIGHVLAHDCLSGLVDSFDAKAIYLDRDHAEITAMPTECPACDVNPETDIAYVIYTSGSTGKPKGVMVQHSAAVNLLTSIGKTLRFGPDDTYLALTTLSFDISVAEIFLPLVTGGSTAIVDRSTARDGNLLVKAIEHHRPTVIAATPPTWRFLIESGWTGEASLTTITTGEAMPKDLAAPLLERSGKLWNLYGPTETTVWSAAWEVHQKDPDRILIGEPIDNTILRIVDDSLNDVSDGHEGELLIGGAGVTLGYLNRPELNRDRFIEVGGQRMYRTGDLARRHQSGLVQCLGRIDSQVKLHGYRIELEEIDVALAQHPDVLRGAAVVREDEPGDLRLIGYVTSRDDVSLDMGDILSSLSGKLPDYMVPSRICVVDSFPQTPSGKLDRMAFPVPTSERPEIGTPFVEPASPLQKQLAEIWGEVLGLNRVGCRDHFFQFGGSSILAQKAVVKIQQQCQLKVTVPELFDHPTIDGLIEYFQRDPANPTTGAYHSPLGVEARSGEYAIVGMAARFPGAKDLEAYWQNLIHNVESIRFFSPQELDPTLGPSVVEDPEYVPARGILDGAEDFDPEFFSISPREAELTDPQQRVLLELAYQGLEDSGYLGGEATRKVGVFAGTYETNYYTEHLLPNQEILNTTGRFQLGVYNEKDYVASRIAHRLNLNGPAINVNTACSTGLVAVIEACKSLELGHCDAAIAGAASIHFPQRSGHLYQAGSILSPDGHCRPFDSEAAGTVFSDGAGVVVLKRLSDAERDGDRVYAVIKGLGINNDGGDKASFTAPSIEGQSAAISMALNDSGLDPASIQYVEAHGTATPIGDPIEVAALQRVYGSACHEQSCGIGSVKSNLGHCVAAAGIAGLIKTTLAIHRGTIPATLHFKSPNPQIDLSDSRFSVVHENRVWEDQAAENAVIPRRAAVSAFGVGGTNAHVILEQAPRQPETAPETERPQILPVSHKRAEALSEAVASTLEFASASDCLPDVAFTLQTGRESFQHRVALVTLPGQSEPVAKFVSPETVTPGDSLWMFPGQGAQYLGMGEQLYHQSDSFRSAFDQCCDLFADVMGTDLRPLIFAKDDVAAVETLNQTEFTQPAIFSVSYSLAKMYLDFGLKPSGMIGHSIGEFVAATIAGVFSLPAAVSLIAQRGRLMQQLPSGSMLSVRMDCASVESRLGGDLSIASDNAPNQCVVAGPSEQITAFESELARESIACRLLRTSHAFHSSMMAPIVEAFRVAVEAASPRPPSIPIRSTATGNWLTQESATSPTYWAQQLRQPVLFRQALEGFAEDQDVQIVLEIGPRQALTTLAKQTLGTSSPITYATSLPGDRDQDSEWIAVLSTLGKHWVRQNPVCWEALHNEVRTKVSAPGYAFQRRRLFIESSAMQGLETPSGIHSPNRSQPETVFDTSPQSIDTSFDMPVYESTDCAVTVTRREQIAEQLKSLFSATSGFDIADTDHDASFFELGMDSLILTQAASAIKKQFQVEVTFRQLLEEFTCLSALVDVLDRELPQDQYTEQVEVAPEASLPQHAGAAPLVTQAVGQAPSSEVKAIIEEQLEIMRQQLAVLGRNNASTDTAGELCETPVSKKDITSDAVRREKPRISEQSSKVKTPAKKTFGAGARVHLDASNATEQQTHALNEFIRRYNRKTVSSKQYAQKHRAHLADPRTVSGFRPDLKEMTYPIVVNRSKGARIWDIDGNDYVDFTCGFGSNFLGHSPDFMVDVLAQQAAQGYEIGPQHPLAGEVAEMFCEMTGAERMAFCNTGSEAVLGACRLARTATGRDQIVMFQDDYHGILDEVVVRGGPAGRSFPAAAGIPRSMVENVVVLPYGQAESLNYIREHLDELAAVVVEPVQSRRPEFQPQQFLQQLAEVLADEPTALIFDEVICGLRIAAGGAQEYFGVKADMGTYGKILGGGMPIGAIAGSAKYLDGLDGGHWQFGDESRPEVGMTYFAGTFVRHPMALAASHATLRYLRRSGHEIYHRINALSDDLARRINAIFQQRNVPASMANFGSLFKTQFSVEQPYSEVFFAMLRERGVHVWDHRPNLLTIAHDAEDIEQIVRAYSKTVDEMIAGDLLYGISDEHHAAEHSHPEPAATESQAPFPVSPAQSEGELSEEQQPTAEQASVGSDARPGKDRDGKPGWFIEDMDNPGQYIQVS